MKITSVKVTPEWRVYILGATLCVALTICSRNFGDRGGPYFMASLTLAGIAYLLAIREFFATPKFEDARRVVVIGLVLAAVWHVEFLRVPAGADDDIHRYVWDGRLQRLGYNPYLVVPSDPAVKGLHTPGNPQLEQPGSAEPISSRGAAFFPRSNRDSGVHLCIQSSICGLRVRDCFRVARCLALYRAGSAPGSGIRLESIVGH